MTNDEAVKILKNEYMCRTKINSCHISGKGCFGCEYDENNDIVTQAINYAVSALSKQCASSEQADQCGNDTEMVDLKKRTITERLIIAESLIYGVIADSDQFRDSAKKTEQPEPKTGHWILSDVQSAEELRNDNYLYYCSECGKGDVHSKSVVVPFCWNCGAKMLTERRNDERMGNS